MKKILILILLLVASGGSLFVKSSAKTFQGPADKKLSKSFSGVQGAVFQKSPLAAGGIEIYTEWETFYVKDGLPNDHIFTIEVDGDRVWVGTENGLALYENKKWRKWQEKDGLPFKVISDIAISPKTGEVWLALFGGGLARFSGGRFDHFNQFNSGLVNDVVYGITFAGDTLWAATTAGVSALNTVSGEWEIYTDKNAPMEEIWCYNADSNDGKVYIAVWGGGILEWDSKTKHWNAHRDPDREMELDLYRDDGLIHNITTSASYIDKTLWASTYFGLSRYDGRHWRGYMDHDSGLPSSFINFAKGKNANVCYNATDKGLAALVDFESDTWVTYSKVKTSDKTWTAHIMKGNKVIKKVSTNLSLPNHFVIALDFQGDDLWIGTGHGIARGTNIQPKANQKFLRSFLQKATPWREK
jgi:ligand-binding sensor domain-containing protein